MTFCKPKLKIKPIEVPIWIVMLSVITFISTNNFFNNDNFFPIDYLYLLEYDGYLKSIQSFLPFEISPSTLRSILYFVITPLSSTYAPLSYIFYPTILIIDDLSISFLFLNIVTIFINSIIIYTIYNRIKDNDIRLFRICMIGVLSSIGGMIYLGTFTPYAYIQLSTILVLVMAIGDFSNPKKDIIILSILYLLNYQIIYVIPIYFGLLIFYFLRKKKLPSKGVVFSFILLMIFIVSSLFFFAIRAKKVGIHESMGLGWNTGLRNEFIFELNKDLYSEFIELVTFLPRSISYHIQPDLFNIEVITFLFWIILMILIISQVVDRFKSKIFLVGLLALLCYLVIVFIGKTSFGPTRHTLFLSPIFLFLFYPLVSRKFTLLVIPILLYFNLHEISNRKIEIPKILGELVDIVKDYPNSDIMLINCSYQPLMDKKFRNLLMDRNIFFYCGSRFQRVLKTKKSTSILLIDSTNKNEGELERSINNRLGDEIYSSSDFSLIKTLINIKYDMEPRDFTQPKTESGLQLWIAPNKLKY